MNPSRLRWPALPFLVLLISGCSQAVSGTALPAGQSVQISVAPEETDLAPEAALQFQATVTGTADTRVDWAVVEGDGGTIDAAGRYVAPATTGTFHVRVTSSADPTRAAIATVKVSTAPPVAVNITPAMVTVAAGAMQAFEAVVSNAADQSVIWSVQEAGCGTITAGGVYTAPAGAATCHVVAHSTADASASGRATVTVAPPPPVIVTVSPGLGSVGGCEQLQLSASVSGTGDTRVTWSVQEGAAGGTVSASGLYTAPSTPGVFHLTARSVAAPSALSTATLTVSEHVLGVQVSPAEVTIPAGGTAQLTATVVTSCGSYTSTQLVAAPN